MEKNNSKDKILKAAEKIMGQKGMNTKISEVAKLAGINQSVIYHYYKNKEDLLFSVAEEHLSNMRNQLEEKLFGIEDTIDKLSIMIGFRLSYVDNYRDYGELYLFECRSNLNFYKHTAFNRTLWFMSKLGEILKEGIEKGVFREGINIWLVRDTLFGLMDVINIDALISGKKIPESLHRDVLKLVLSLLGNEAKGKKEDKRLKIIEAAEKIFAQKGYENAKMQEIAKEAMVGDGTLYEYFKNKEELLFSVLEEGFKPSTLKKGFQTHLLAEKRQINDNISKLENFLRNHFLICLTQPSFVKIFVLHGIYNRNYHNSGSIKYFENYFGKLEEIIGNSGLKTDAQKDLFIKMITGSFCHITLRWLVSEDKVKDRVKEINQIIDMLLQGIEKS